MAKMPFMQALALGRQHLQARRFAEAEAVGRSLLASLPDQPEAYRLLGHGAGARRVLVPAEAWFRQALERDPSAAECYADLSYVLRLEGRHGEAEAAARQALGLRLSWSRCTYQLGSAPAALGR